MPHLTDAEIDADIRRMEAELAEKRRCKDCGGGGALTRQKTDGLPKFDPATALEPAALYVEIEHVRCPYCRGRGQV